MSSWTWSLENTLNHYYSKMFHGIRITKGGSKFVTHTELSTMCPNESYKDTRRGLQTKVLRRHLNVESEGSVMSFSLCFCVVLLVYISFFGCFILFGLSRLLLINFIFRHKGWGRVCDFFVVDEVRENPCWVAALMIIIVDESFDNTLANNCQLSNWRACLQVTETG